MYGFLRPRLPRAQLHVLHLTTLVPRISFQGVSDRFCVITSDENFVKGMLMLSIDFQIWYGLEKMTVFIFSIFTRNT